MTDAARWQRDHMAEKRSLLAHIKHELGCADCGIDNPVVLDFDHRAPLQKNPALLRAAGTAQRTLVQLGWDALWAELEKCDVRCANCHRIRTHEQRLAGVWPKGVGRPQREVLD